METGREAVQLRRVVGVGEAVYVAAGARAEVVRALGAAELRAAAKVVMQGEAVVALLGTTEGMTLADVLRATGPLTAGGCVWVGTRVARALARLHKAGLAHGAVTAENVLLESGIAVLLDTGAGVADATQADDVEALGMMLREAVRPGDADLIAAWTDPMSAPDPAGRPTAAMVARALPGAAQERPVALPGPSVADTVRERIGAAPEPVSAGAGRPARERAVVESASRNDEPRDGTGWFTRAATAASTTPRRLVSLGVASLVSVALLGASLWLLVGPDDAAAAESGAGADAAVTEAARTLRAGTAASHLSDPGSAASALTLRRFAALQEGDGSALLATTALDSEARARAEDQASSLDSGALAYEGLEVEVLDVVVLSATDQEAVVEVEYAAASHVALVEGEPAAAEASAERVALTLVAERGRWLVSSVADA